jgi:pyruvate carboxylase subunit B
MKYVVRVGERELAVNVAGGAVQLGGHSYEARLESVDGSPVRILTVGAEVRRVVVRRGAERGRYTLWIDGNRFDVEALDERTHAIRGLSSTAVASSGPAPVVAPMPGLIVRVNVAPGDAVRAGQGVVVIEAMKMENELRAAAAGTVKAVLVQAGAAVEKGAVLVQLE